MYVVLAAIIATGGVFAVPAGVVRAETDGYYTYTLTGDNATITGYTGPGGAVVIPATLGGHLVTSIGPNAFAISTTLTSVTIPDSVTNIGYGAFRGRSGLTAITVAGSNTAYSSQDGVLFNKAKTSILQYPGGKAGSYMIPESVTSIADYAFVGCTVLTSVTIGSGMTSISDSAFYLCTGLTSVTLGSGVTSIGEMAFMYCTGLTSVTIPDLVTSIGAEAFTYCSGLTGVTIGSGVTSIGDYAFFNCTGLTSVTIPDLVTSIGTEAFGGCEGLTEINVAGSNTAYSSQDGVLFNKAKTSILQYPSGKTGSYMIPVSVTLIGEGSFYLCTGLTSVTIGSGVTSIGENAFDACSGLTSVTIPAGVTSIGFAAFGNCSALTSVTIPDGVTSIGDQAFAGCSGLTAAYLLGNAPSGTWNMFDGCPGGFTVYYVSGKTGWTNPWYGYPTATLTKAISAFTIPAQVGYTTINEGDHTIALTMPSGTVRTALVPTISVSAGASVNPASGIPQNFTNPVTYTVTAADSSAQHYVVTVTVAASPLAVTNNRTTNITATSATLNGNLAATSGKATTVHIYGGTIDSGTNPDNWEHDLDLGVVSEGAFYKDIMGLRPSTRYYYRCYAENSGGTAWATESASFVTQSTWKTYWDGPGNDWWRFSSGMPR